ncbi:F-box protein CPR1-like [Papaver somniferum]|uniref:F-box protein CPR1-like n=1 Tax=Papaver somniferum TaxID=3469 RepID=UPI000E705E0A|nr:F-box protein CPR1-like [Papaver somniferum]
MDAISDDIVVDIFARLPARSVCALRCVCKSWLNIITHPYFVKIHHDYAIHKNKSSLLLINYLDKRIYSVVDYEASSPANLGTAAAFVIDYPFKSPDYGVQFWATCNGLFCMATGKDIICIWNPSIQEYKKIELMNTSVNEEYALSGTFRYGLGYDSNIGDYKLVRILGYSDNAVTPRWILKLRDPIYRDDRCGVEVYT